MNSSILNNKDVWAGLLLIAIGAAAIFLARDYTFGTALRMGPGFFPIVLGAVLILFGLYTLATGTSAFTRVFRRAMRDGTAIEGSWSPRALIVLPPALILFGLLIEHAGFVPAMLVLIFASAAASTEFKFMEVLLFALGLTALAVAVFIWGLGLPYPLFTAFG